MAYATLQDMKDRYDESELIQLTDRVNVTVIDVTVLNAKFADADALIDGYLQGKYDLPILDTPQNIVRIACALTRYFLYRDDRPDAVEQDYKDAIKYLSDVSRGIIQLGLTNSNTEILQTAAPTVDAEERIFSRTQLKGY